MSIALSANDEGRYASLDYIRGLSIFGILFVNALAFGHPFDVYAGAAGTGVPFTEADRIAKWAMGTFAHSKFITMFSMLFGISVFLVGESAKDAKGLNTPLFRRLFWLVVFGLIHGMVIWLGDVLLLYALCGFLMMAMFRKRSAKLLLIAGGIWYGLLSLLPVVGVLAMIFVPGAQDHAPKAPEAPDLTALIEQMRSGLMGSLEGNFDQWLGIAPFASGVYIILTLPLLMIGLGLFKSGFFKGESPAWVYVLMAVIGGLNLAAIGFAFWQHIVVQAASAKSWALLAEVSPPIFISLGYASAVMLIMRFGLGRLIMYPIKCAGKMAFTNYLSQSLIMTALFYGGRFPFPEGLGVREALMAHMGHDLPWYGLFNHSTLASICVVIVVFQLVFSTLWMQAFRYGPFEWVWRSLTQGRAVRILK